MACILYSTGYVVDQFTGGIKLKYDALGGEVSLSYFVGGEDIITQCINKLIKHYSRT